MFPNKPQELVQSENIKVDLEGFRSLYRVTEKDIRCAVINLYHEARGEPVEGQKMVVQVVINRTMHNKKFGSTLCKTIEEYKQFSWMLDLDKSYMLYSKQLQIPLSSYLNLKELVQEVISEQSKISLDKRRVFYYHTNKVKPVWRKNLKVHSVIGNHIFYTED